MASVAGNEQVGISGDNSAQKSAAADGSDDLAIARQTEEFKKVGVLLRAHDMLSQLGVELHPARLDAGARDRLGRLLGEVVVEVSMVIGSGAREELHRMIRPLSATPPSDGELRIVHTQLLAWLEAALTTLPDTLDGDQAQAATQ